jgi:hypothetical protein
VFDEVCLPNQNFCFTNIFGEIHIKVVTKMIQYRIFPQNYSPVGNKWREFYVDVEFRKTFFKHTLKEIYHGYRFFDRENYPRSILPI